jgi:hypothetical protein
MQMLWLLCALGLGAILCLLGAGMAVMHWQLPWKQTLMYFGLMPYPDEVPRKRRRRTAKRPVRTGSRPQPAVRRRRAAPSASRRAPVRG